MPQYRRGGIEFLLNFVQPSGTVFPAAVLIALFPAAFTGLLVWLVHKIDAIPYLKEPDAVMKSPAIWSSFNFLVSFLVVFRTSQSYSRFWDGCTMANKMGAEWFNSCAALMSFTRFSKAAEADKLNFANTLIRLFSMLHAAALGELEDTGEARKTRKKGCYEAVAAFKMDLIDIEGIDEESLRTIRDCDSKVELIFQWIQQIVVQGHKNGIISIEPPILTRAFQEFARGMAHFHDARTVSRVPFPFQYAVTCDLLLVLQWVMVPFVVCHWCTQIPWGVTFAFVQVFTMWSLNLIAMQLENPFGADPNDVDGVGMQFDMNLKLRLLFQVSGMELPKVRMHEGEDQTTIALRVTATNSVSSPQQGVDAIQSRSSFAGVWEVLSPKSSRTLERQEPAGKGPLERQGSTLGEALGSHQVNGHHKPPSTLMGHTANERLLAAKPVQPKVGAEGAWEPLEVADALALGHSFADRSPDHNHADLPVVNSEPHHQRAPPEHFSPPPRHAGDTYSPRRHIPPPLQQPLPRQLPPQRVRCSNCQRPFGEMDTLCAGSSFPGLCLSCDAQRKLDQSLPFDLRPPGTRLHGGSCRPPAEAPLPF